MPDAIFAERRLAEIYDLVDDDRSDLEVYDALVDELGAASVLDIGCGTGTFACLLAARGKVVTGLDPALASLAVARRKQGSERVRWIHGDASAIPALRTDLVTMTGNVAQVFLGDDEWAVTLRAARSALRPGGHLVFETREPTREAWQAWTRADTYRRVDTDAGGVETWVDVTDLRLPFVSFRRTYVFQSDGAVMTSHSTLRFRGRAEVEGVLEASGFVVEEVRDAPDRPGLELVFITSSTGERASGPPTAAEIQEH